MFSINLTVNPHSLQTATVRIAAATVPPPRLVNCPNCGSQLFVENSAREGMIGIRAGTIDQTDLIQPARNVYVSSKIPSTLIDLNLPASNRMPES